MKTNEIAKMTPVREFNPVPFEGEKETLSKTLSSHLNI